MESVIVKAPHLLSRPTRNSAVWNAIVKPSLDARSSDWPVFSAIGQAPGRDQLEVPKAIWIAPNQAPLLIQYLRENGHPKANIIGIAENGKKSASSPKIRIAGPVE